MWKRAIGKEGVTVEIMDTSIQLDNLGTIYSHF